MEEKPKAKRGFAAMSLEQRRKIASMGGKATPGNFKNDRKRASVLGKKGGTNSRKNKDAGNTV